MCCCSVHSGVSQLGGTNVALERLCVLQGLGQAERRVEKSLAYLLGDDCHSDRSTQHAGCFGLCQPN